MAAIDPTLQTPDTAEENGRRQPDPRALAVARALQDHLPEAEIILFGSRATGTWNSGSDIDLALIGTPPETEAMIAVKNQVHAVAGEEYNDHQPHIQITTIPRPDFEELRTSFPHIAGQVQCGGLTPTGDRLPVMPQDNPWPGVQEKLQATQDHLRRALHAMGGGDPADALFHAEEALENCLKAALGINRLPFGKHHNLELLVDSLSEVRSEWLEGMLSNSQLTSLADFREQAVYGGRHKNWPSDEPQELVEAVQQSCSELAGHILKHLGKTPREVKYEHWLDDEPLGGLESLPIPPTHLSSEDWRTIGNLEALLLTGVATQEEFEMLEGDWMQNGPPQDARERIKNALNNPGEWRKWLFGEHRAGRETNQPPA